MIPSSGEITSAQESRTLILDQNVMLDTQKELAELNGKYFGILEQKEKMLETLKIRQHLWKEKQS